MPARVSPFKTKAMPSQAAASGPLPDPVSVQAWPSYMAHDLDSLSHILSELGVMESNYLFCGRLALVSIRITARQPQGTPNHVPVAGTCRISAAVGKVK